MDNHSHHFLVKIVKYTGMQCTNCSTNTIHNLCSTKTKILKQLERKKHNHYHEGHFIIIIVREYACLLYCHFSFSFKFKRRLTFLCTFNNSLAHSWWCFISRNSSHFQRQRNKSCSYCFSLITCTYNPHFKKRTKRCGKCIIITFTSCVQ